MPFLVFPCFSSGTCELWKGLRLLLDSTATGVNRLHLTLFAPSPQRLIPCLGCALLFFLFVRGFVARELLSLTSLLWHGVTTQGVITDEEGRNGGKHWGQNLSAQCPDQTGQAYTSTFSRCAYGVSSATSPGSSLTIVYASDNPTTTATPRMDSSSTPALPDWHEPLGSLHTHLPAGLEKFKSPTTEPPE